MAFSSEVRHNSCAAPARLVALGAGSHTHTRKHTGTFLCHCYVVLRNSPFLSVKCHRDRMVTSRHDGVRRLPKFRCSVLFCSEPVTGRRIQQNDDYQPGLILKHCTTHDGVITAGWQESKRRHGAGRRAGSCNLRLRSMHIFLAASMFLTSSEAIFKVSPCP